MCPRAYLQGLATEQDIKWIIGTTFYNLCDKIGFRILTPGDIDQAIARYNLCKIIYNDTYFYKK